MSSTEIGEEADDDVPLQIQPPIAHDSESNTALSPSESLSTFELCEVEHIPTVQLLPGCQVETLHSTLYINHQSGTSTDKKLFWLPYALDGPIDVTSHRWCRVDSILGRVQWPHGVGGTLSYEHPWTSKRYFTLDGSLYVVHWSSSSDCWVGASNKPTRIPRALRNRSPIPSEWDDSSDDDSVTLKSRTRRRRNAPPRDRRPVQLFAGLSFAMMIFSLAKRRE